ncbi:MAG: hypothetical protein SFY81_05685, partial [Verrucomicrobiota bacterium]|nr:hypothetical protein [Verrucomicrobiota bacterium]
MILRSHQFEKAATRLFAQELKRDTSLRKRVRQHTFNYNVSFIPFLRKIALPLIIFFFLIGLRASGLQELALAIVAIWLTSAIFRKTHQFQEMLYGSHDLIVMQHLPLTDDQVFRAQCRRFFQNSTWILYEVGLAYLALLGRGSWPPGFVWIFLLTLLQGVLVVAIVMHMTAWLPQFPHTLVASMLVTICLLLLFTREMFPTFVSQVIRVTHWATPAGWLQHLYTEVTIGKDYLTLLLLLPVGLIIYAAIWSFNRIRSNYVWDVPISEYAEYVQAHVQAEERQLQGPVGLTELHDNISERKFLDQVNWSGQGLIEGIVWKFLSSRERDVSEFINGPAPGWTRQIQAGALILAIALPLLYLAGLHENKFGLWMTTYIYWVSVLPILGRGIPGIELRPMGGVYAPVFAAFPIAYAEVAWTLLKVNLVKAVIGISLLLLFGIALESLNTKNEHLSDLLLTGKLALLMLAFQPLSVALKISSASNDTTQMKLHWQAMIYGGIIAVIGLALWFLFAPPLLAFAILYPILVVVSIGALVLHRFLYKRNAFDLLTST